MKSKVWLRRRTVLIEATRGAIARTHASQRVSTWKNMSLRLGLGVTRVKLRHPGVGRRRNWMNSANLARRSANGL